MPILHKVCPWCGKAFPSTPVTVVEGEMDVMRLTAPGICDRCRFTMLGPLAEIPTAAKPVTKFCVHGRPLIEGPEGWCDACESEV